MARVTGVQEKYPMAERSPKKDFGSARDIERVKKEFGDRATSVTVSMKYVREIGSFLKKIEQAHKAAERSKLSFG